MKKNNITFCNKKNNKHKQPPHTHPQMIFFFPKKKKKKKKKKKRGFINTNIMASKPAPKENLEPHMVMFSKKVITSQK